MKKNCLKKFVSGPKIEKLQKQTHEYHFWKVQFSLIVLLIKMPFILDNVARLLYKEQQVDVDVPANRHNWRGFEWGNPCESMTDGEFRLNFRLSKESVIELTRLITPHLHVDKRSHTLTPIQMVCICLDNLGADKFQRITAWLVQCDQGVVCWVLDKVFY